MVRLYPTGAIPYVCRDTNGKKGDACVAITVYSKLSFKWGGLIMRWTRLLCLVLAAAVAGLAMVLAGCGTSAENREIPSEFAGDYSGGMTLAPDTIGGIRATIFPSGSVELDVFTTSGAFIATGGIDTGNQLTATGFLNSAQIDFIGTWTADGFGAATGTWIDRSTNATGSWSITQNGLTTTEAVGSYSGTYTMPGFNGAVTFNVDVGGITTGTATGFELFDTSLSGAVNRNNQVVLAGTTGITGTGAAVFFVGTLNTTAFTISGTAGTSLAGGTTGTWTAAQTP